MQFKVSLLISVFVTFIVSYQITAQEVTSLTDSLSIKGSLGSRLIGYSAKGIPNRRVPFSYILNGDVTISKGDFSIPISFIYSEQHRGFSHPFNQFGLAPSYKWITAYLGYQYLNYSKFTLAGHQILGGGVALNPGKFRFSFMGGRFHRATGVNEDVVQRFLPTYDRYGFSTKIGFGTEERFFDLIYLRAKDNSDSAPYLYADSTILVQPAQNTVLGFNSRFKIKNFMQLYAEGAVSVYNRNTNALEVNFESEELVTTFLGKPTIATQVYFGGEVGSNFNFKGHNINVFYKRISPDYKSMGVYFIENDINATGFRHNFSFWKNKCLLNYGMSVFNDNLLNKKSYTTFRYQPNLNLSFNPIPKFGVDINWMDLYTQQRDGLVAVNDTIIMNNRNPGITISPRYFFGSSKYYHMFNANYMNMRMIDNNAFTSVYMEYKTEIINLMYTISLLKKNISINTSVNRTANTTNLFNEVGYGFSGGYNQSWKEGKLSYSGTIGMQFSNINTNYTISNSLNYTINQKHSLGTSLVYLVNRTNNENSLNFEELTVNLNYAYTF